MSTCEIQYISFFFKDPGNPALVNNKKWSKVNWIQIKREGRSPDEPKPPGVEKKTKQTTRYGCLQQLEE